MSVTQGVANDQIAKLSVANRQIHQENSMLKKDMEHTSIYRLKKFTLDYITVTRLRPHTVPAAECAGNGTGTVRYIHFIHV